MLKAPNDTGKRMRAYLSILLVPPIPAVVGWEHGDCLGSILFPIVWMCSSLGPRRFWREEEPVLSLDGVSPGTAGVDGGAGGRFFTVKVDEAALDWLVDLGLEHDRLEELPVITVVEQDWLEACGCLVTPAWGS